jgi:hypothetical protein
MKSEKLKYISIFATLSFIAMIIVNVLANTLPINGLNTGEISDLYVNLFVPAGITFSIWGIIYLLLGGYIIYQLILAFDRKKRTKKEQKKKQVFEKIGIYFIITSLLNISWILLWHHLLIELSVLVMIALLATIIRIANIIKKEKISVKELWFLKIPFSMYLGWIIIATIANITALLVKISWNGFGISEATWTLLILLVGASIGIARMLKDKNYFYGLVFIWAYIGIYLRHNSVQGFNQQYPEIIMMCIFCIGLFFVAGTHIACKKKINKKNSKKKT